MTKNILPWEKIDVATWIIKDEDAKEIGKVTKYKMSYTAYFLKGEEMIKDHFISLKSSQTWVNDKLKTEGYKEKDK